MSGATMAAEVLAACCEGSRKPSMQAGESPAPAGDGFVDVRDPHTNKLLFRYDPARRLVEIVRRGVVTVVDLKRIG